MLSRLSVRCSPESRFRHWCSYRYLRIPPLHPEFHSPLDTSRLVVSEGRSRLSREISPQTGQSACARFTPSKSGQRSPPTYYRGCWHVVSRDLFVSYRQIFFTHKRGLQPEGIHPPRDVTASGFRPLRNFLCCCPPKESGPCLSPCVAVRPLRPATDRHLGRPLPHRQANPPQAHPKAPEGFHPQSGSHGVLVLR